VNGVAAIANRSSSNPNFSLARQSARRQQQIRDRKRRLCDLANNNSALDLKHSAAQVWLVGPGAADLANNNSAPAQIWVIEALAPGRTPLPASCKQQPAGVAVDPAI
jgi:hypothetical protein